MECFDSTVFRLNNPVQFRAELEAALESFTALRLFIREVRAQHNPSTFRDMSELEDKVINALNAMDRLLLVDETPEVPQATIGSAKRLLRMYKGATEQAIDNAQSAFTNPEAKVLLDTIGKQLTPLFHQVSAAVDHVQGEATRLVGTENKSGEIKR